MRFPKFLTCLLLVVACAETMAPIDIGAPPCRQTSDCDADAFCDRGYCMNLVCRLDGRLTPGEGCDDGNSDPKDGCTTECVPARCGDGILRADRGPGEPGYEACDDANQEMTDDCLNNCTRAACGDGYLRSDTSRGEEGFEACDDGNLDDTDACTNRCTLSRCGDGIQRTDRMEGDDEFEACDDGNQDDYDGCTNACQLARCGDGLRRADQALDQRDFEACDDGNDAQNDHCLNNCQVNRCGDGHWWPEQEACDDGNDVIDDACIDCALPRCGDGILRRDLQPDDPNYEACDDGNAVDTDSCLSNCQVARCGDGVIRLDFESRLQLGFEDCEPETYAGDLHCSSWCHEMPPPPRLAIGRHHHCVHNQDGLRCAGRVQARIVGGSREWTQGPVAYAVDDIDGLRLATGTAGSFLCYTNGQGSGSCWDMDQYASIARWHPVGSPEPLVDVTQNLGLGPFSLSCSLTRMGRVYCWGPSNLAPVQIPGLGMVIHIAQTQDQYCSVNRAGEGFCWGRDLLPIALEGLPPLRSAVPEWSLWFGPAESVHALSQDGAIIVYPEDEIDDSIPVPATQLVSHPEGLTICALANNGLVYCKGANGQYGLLGVGDPGPIWSEDAFVEVVNLTEVVEIRSGKDRYCALRENGELWCWGRIPHPTRAGIGYTTHTSPHRIAGFPAEVQ